MRLALFACLALTAAFVGCDREKWHVDEHVRATPADVSAALGDTSHQNSTGMAASDVPEITYPRALRPCCAFGADYGVAVGQVRLPGVEIGNLLGPDDVGPHRYDNGFISISASDPRGYVDRENNGLIYTCRGGFLDFAHIRDTADTTLSLAASNARGMDAGTVIEAPPQGAAIRVRVRAIPEPAIEKHERIRLATAMAQWAAYQVSIWHEIATFYGFASMARWPEKISAFSPEDYYSNQLGARIAGGIILSRGARSDIEYAANMDAWIDGTLERLVAVPLDDSRAAMNAVEGVWWDKTNLVPDWTLVKRRQFTPGPELWPWRLEAASADVKGPIATLARCRDVAPPLVLHIPDGFAGVPFRDYVTVELDVSDTLASAGFPFPRPDSRVITQEDFPAVIEAARVASVA